MTHPPCRGCGGEATCDAFGLPHCVPCAHANDESYRQTIEEADRVS